MLRRKRGADYDLSDSDDGGEAKRRMKRRQFAKMQKALYADERISKVAENPRSKAFMRTIEDVGSDEEMDFLFEPQQQQQQEQHEPSSATHVSNTTAGNASQEQQQHHVVPDSQPAAATTTTSAQQQRPAAAERRAQISRKPANLNEVRRTLSSLLDDPSENSVIPSTDFGSEDDENENDEDVDAVGGEKDRSPSANKENSNPRRRGRVSASAVVDRISLKRQSSSNVSSNGSGSGGKMAFTAPSSSASNGGFRVPALLRKATTNSFMSTGSASGAGVVGGSSKGSAAGGSGSGFGDEGKIKKNAGKRSGISYLARETDRRAKLAEAERKREEKKIKAVEGRSKVVGGLFGAGRFE